MMNKTENKPPRLRVAFIGCGGITRAHLHGDYSFAGPPQGIASFADVELVGWCSRQGDSARELADQHGGRAFCEISAMLDETAPDAVFIMLPPFAHGEAEREVIRRGIPFFVEKPIHLDFAEARGFLQEIEAKGLPTGVGFMNRFRRGVQRVGALLREQPAVLFYGGWIGGGPAHYKGAGKWWVQKAMSGGQFSEQTIHLVDLARYLGGDVEEVHAQAVKDRLPRPDFFTLEDASAVNLRLSSGAAASIFSSVSCRVGRRVFMTVYGTDFRAEFSGEQHDLLLDLPGGEQVAIPGETHKFVPEDRAFLEYVRTGRKPDILASYADGVAAMAIAEAANRSMATGLPVKLSEL